MAGKKVENTKKVAGNAKKAEVAAQKAAAENVKNAALEEQDWGKGAKSNAKKYVSYLTLKSSFEPRRLELILLCK